MIYHNCMEIDAAPQPVVGLIRERNVSQVCLMNQGQEVA